MDYKELIEQQEKEREKLYYDRHTDYSYWGKLAFENPGHAGYEHEKQSVMKSYGEREQQMMATHVQQRDAWLTANERSEPTEDEVEKMVAELERIKQKNREQEQSIKL